MLLLVLLRILVVVVRFVLDPWSREVRIVDVRFSRPAMWLTTATFSLAACGVGAPSLPIQVPVPSTAAEAPTGFDRSEEHTSELQSQSNLVCRLLLEKKKQKKDICL